MKKFLFLWMVVLLFAFSKDAYAVYFFLTDEQIRQAIEYGEKNKDLDYISFFDEWVVVSHDGYE